MKGWVYPLSYSESTAKLFCFGNGPYADIVDITITNVVYSATFTEICSSYPDTCNPAWWSDTLPLNTWSHMASTFSELTISLYINGVMVASGSAPEPPNVFRTQNYVGKSDWSDNPLVDANIDELKMFDRALTQAEVHFEMNNGMFA